MASAMRSAPPVSATMPSAVRVRLALAAVERGHEHQEPAAEHAARRARRRSGARFRISRSIGRTVQCGTRRGRRDLNSARRVAPQPVICAERCGEWRRHCAQPVSGLMPSSRRVRRTVRRDTIAVTTGHQDGDGHDGDEAAAARSHRAEQGLDLRALRAWRPRCWRATRRAGRRRRPRDPPISPPRRPSRRKCRWNSPAMKLSLAPTKCSTSTISRLPAMAPRVAKTTARPVAASTRATIADAQHDERVRHGREALDPDAVVVERGAAHRVRQRGLRRAAKSGAVGAVDLAARRCAARAARRS